MKLPLNAVDSGRIALTFLSCQHARHYPCKMTMPVIPTGWTRWTGWANNPFGPMPGSLVSRLLFSLFMPLSIFAGLASVGAP